MPSSLRPATQHRACVSRSGIKQESVSLKNSPRSCLPCQCTLGEQKRSSFARWKGKNGEGNAGEEPHERLFSRQFTIEMTP